MRFRRFALLSSLLPLPALAEPAPAAPLSAQTQTAAGGQSVTGTKTDGLRAWIAAFRPRALAAGITPATLDRAFQDVTYNPDVIEKDRNQAEFTRALWDYLDSAVSEDRVANGIKALRANAPLLDRIEATYGVPKEGRTAGNA